KGAKLLGLPYPGGPMIDNHAKEGDSSFHKFPRAFLKGDNFDFSYSGLKTSLLVYLKDKTDVFIKSNFSDICASYQEAAVDVLVIKALNAAKKFKVKSVGIVGGVAANSLLRKKLAEEIIQHKMDFFLPDYQFCTDNAAMIARAGAERLSAGIESGMSLNAYPSLKLNQ
ncbi:MAG: tRNA (adenosine(37)-N6)-threonylcarbamoyltransferase complex transferase subunit TsaD, partial [Calditrichia bacterium]|nr:tRNA (adenosine(37)-N6)-threonylcarbamoyltransferase complex transferase subunit TsaD [Calditrichia bacterium]